MTIKNSTRYVSSLLAPLAFASWVSGCTAIGYQEPRHDQKIVQTLVEKEYGEPIDEFAAQQIARLSIPVTSTVLPQEEDITQRFTAKYSTTRNYQINDGLRTDLDEIITQNIVMELLTEQSSIQRWLADSAKKNARWSYTSKPLQQDENAFVEKYLDYLTASLEHLDAAKRTRLSASKDIQKYLEQNREELQYLVKLLTAKADIETIEFNVAEMHRAYQRIASIKKSLDGIDTYAHAKTIWNDIKKKQTGTLFKEDNTIFASERITREQTLEEAYGKLLADAEEILKQDTYKDKHEAFQNNFSSLLEIPTSLYDKNLVSAEDALTLKAQTVKDIADIFKKNNVKNLPGLDLKIAGLSAIPYVGIFVDIDKWGIAFTKDVFRPQTDTPVEQFAEILKEGHRLGSGNGNSDKWIGSTDPAIDECVITVASTAITTVGIIGGVMQGRNHGHHPKSPASNSPPTPPSPPPIDGGGTITPGTGN